MSDELRNAPEAPDVPDAEARVAELETLLAEAQADRLRALAEMENVRKRLTREKEQFCEFANEGLLADLLPVLDNLDMALAYAPADAPDPAVKGFVSGVAATRKIFLDILARHGLTPVGEEGQSFDPAWHEAVGFDETSSLPAQTICKLMQSGYTLKQRLLRPARVLVSKPC